MGGCRISIRYRDRPYHESSHIFSHTCVHSPRPILCRLVMMYTAYVHSYTALTADRSRIRDRGRCECHRSRKMQRGGGETGVIYLSLVSRVATFVESDCRSVVRAPTPPPLYRLLFTVVRTGSHVTPCTVRSSLRPLRPLLAQP